MRAKALFKTHTMNHENTDFNKEMNEKKKEIKKALQSQYERQWDDMKGAFLDDVLKFIKEYND